MIGKRTIGQKTMRIFISIILITTIIQSLGFAASSAEMNILLEMKDTKLQMGTGTQLSLVLRNVDGNAELIDFKGIENFEVMSQNQSQSSSNINGKVTKEVSVNYMVMPKNIGSYDLQAILKIDGKTYESNKLSVIVEEQDEQLSQVSEDIFLKTTVSKNQLYFGESAVVTYELYSRYQVDQYGFTEAIEGDGFIIEESDNSGSGSSFIMINGNKYAKYTAKQLIINPTDTGDYTLPSFNFQVNISTGNFFGETKPVYFKSDEVAFSVKPLPANNKPENFSGLTGKIDLDYSYSADSLASNEPLTLNVTVSGDGNLYVLDGIADYMSLDDFSVYETEKLAESMTTEEGQRTKKNYEIILIPKKSGLLTIPKMQLPYFNTDTEAYEDLIINDKKIDVTGPPVLTAISNDEALSTANGSGEALLIDQVNYGSYGDDYIVIALAKSTVKKSLGVVIAVIILVTSGVFLLRKKRKQLKTYLKSLKTLNDEASLYDFFSSYMQKEHNVSIKSMTAEQVSSALSGMNQLEKVVDLLNYFNEERYNKKRSLDLLKGKVKAIMMDTCKI